MSADGEGLPDGHGGNNGIEEKWSNLKNVGIYLS
jgi:hypothetical protein